MSKIVDKITRSSRGSFGSSDVEPSTPSSITTVEELFDANLKATIAVVGSEVDDAVFESIDNCYKESIKDTTKKHVERKELSIKVPYNNNNTTRDYSTVKAIAAASLDLIQLKSPQTSPTGGKLTNECSHRRRSADVADVPQNYTEHELLNQVNSNAERGGSALLTPTATSFSKDDLNEIFNISRDSMDVIERSAPPSTAIIPSNIEDNAMSVTMTSPEKCHNIAINESNFSMNSSLLDNSYASQTDNEMNSSRCMSSDDNNNTNNHVTSARSPPDAVNKSSVAMDTPPPGKTGSLSKLQMVCREIFMTEKSYVNDLQDIIEGYIYHLKQKGDLDVESIFGNLEDIYEFNKDVLYQIEQCGLDNYEIDAILLAKVFCEKARGFNTHYTKYCTNYPEASQFFSIIMQDQGINDFFVERQRVIGHALPLQTYLLKPVQRIMKYHLLFGDILKRYEGDEDGYNTIHTAMLAMTDVAEYINEMKRLQENAVKVQEIISNIAYLDEPIDVYVTGRLVLENSFKVQGVRSDRIMYLFEKLLLICKKSENNFLQFKEKIECCNMMLVESIGKDPLGFQIMRFDNRKVNYTITAKTLDIKKEWVKQLKRLILENHAAVIPQTARQAILGPEDKAKSKYNSLPIQALDDQINVRHMKKNKHHYTTGKENAMSPVGMKRESNEKESSFLPKRPLNSKAKEFIMDKKTRNSLSASNLSLASASSQQQPAEKEKKEYLRFMRRNKTKPNLGNVPILDSPSNSQSDVYMTSGTTETRLKSRSLESLKDAIVKNDQQYIEEIHNGSSILKDIINYNFEQKLDDAIEETIASGKRSRPVSMVKSESSTTDGDTSPECGQNIEHLERPVSEIITPKDTSKLREQFTSGIKITKSMSVKMRKKTTTSSDDVSVYEECKKRWTQIPNDVDRLERLEHRLSILSDDGDDGMSITSIKNMVRRVSNAFNTSFQAYDDSSRSMVESDSNVTRDLDKILGNSDELSYYKSTGCIIDGHDDELDDTANRSKSECLSSNNEDGIESETKADESLKAIDTDSDINMNRRWSEDVDQVFDEVNADIDSIANSIESVPTDNDVQQNADCEQVTSDGMEITDRSALVDMRLKEANNSENVVLPMSTKKVNVEVKRVADRIKEYKRLIDSEKRRHSWRRREPKTMNEVMENLENINPTENGLTPTYSHLRRRFRNSRDFEGSSIGSLSEMSPHSSYGSIRRSMSENYATELENDVGRPLSLSSTPTSFIAPHTEKIMKDSIATLSRDRSLSSTEDIVARTERYKKALKNCETKPKSNSTSSTSVPSSHSDMMSTAVVRRVPPNGSHIFYNPDTGEYTNHRDSGEWNRRSQTLPHPRRTNAIKRSMRKSLSEENEDDQNVVVSRSRSRSSDNLDKEDECPVVVENHIQNTPPSPPSNDNTIITLTNDKSATHDGKSASPNSKRYQRSISLPRQKKRNIHNPILEEKPAKKTDNDNNKAGDDISGDVISGDVQAIKTKHMNIPRGRSRRQLQSVPDSHSPSALRSVSLPRRAPICDHTHVYDDGDDDGDDDNVDVDEKTSSLTILRSPSIRCIQSNHVTNRVKNYFTNLQKSTQISRSRPNLVFAPSNSFSDSDPETSSNDDRTSIDEVVNGNGKNETIMKGTVRSMIQRYGKKNYVFDNYNY